MVKSNWLALWSVQKWTTLSSVYVMFVSVWICWTGFMVYLCLTYTQTYTHTRRIQTMYSSSTSSSSKNVKERKCKSGEMVLWSTRINALQQELKQEKNSNSSSSSTHIRHKTQQHTKQEEEEKEKEIIHSTANTHARTFIYSHLGILVHSDHSDRRAICDFLL